MSAIAKALEDYCSLVNKILRGVGILVVVLAILSRLPFRFLGPKHFFFWGGEGLDEFFCVVLQFLIGPNTPQCISQLQMSSSCEGSKKKKKKKQTNKQTGDQVFTRRKLVISEFACTYRQND